MALLTLALATDTDRQAIYRLRHTVYACELGQHPVNEFGILNDSLDEFNVYFVARCGGEIAGFISVTPPDRDRYSIDKYFARHELPFILDQTVFEVRLLTVLPAYRNTEVAPLLMHTAYRYVQSQGGRTIVGIGRAEVMDLYQRAGLCSLGCRVQSGMVAYELMNVQVTPESDRVVQQRPLLEKIRRRIVWDLDFPYFAGENCFHGGRFFEAVGDDFDSLERRHKIVNADVLDAWFDPCPGAVEALEDHLSWLLKTSPPAHAQGLVRAIAESGHVPKNAIAVGAGSSSLIFLAFRQWLTAGSRALILDPSYGEYAHVLEQIIGCRVDRMQIVRNAKFAVDCDYLENRLRAGQYDLVILINPNNPTGSWLPRHRMAEIIAAAPPKTRIWIDEAYINYVDPVASMEVTAAKSRNVYVCKSLSKVYALSGVRAAYLIGPPAEIAEIRAITPPWAVSLPAQVAAVAALRDRDYYPARYLETHVLRAELADNLRAAIPGMEVLESPANWVIGFLPSNGASAENVCNDCAAQGVFIRDLSIGGSVLGRHAIRIAVKCGTDNERIVDSLRRVTLAATDQKVRSPYDC